MGYPLTSRGRAQPRLLSPRVNSKPGDGELLPRTLETYCGKVPKQDQAAAFREPRQSDRHDLTASEPAPAQAHVAAKNARAVF